MKHNPITNTRFFFSTEPLPCPYLPDREERRIVTELLGRDALQIHNRLSEVGFRRSHNIAYSPACPECQACKPVRIVVKDFKLSRSQNRLTKKNKDLLIKKVSLKATPEQYELFLAYQVSRHSDGDMSKMIYKDYQSLIEETPVDSELVEFRLADLTLVAVCLLDRVDNGLSAVYSFYQPSMSYRSLGTYMILWLAEYAKSIGLEFVYLGFWISGCSKMSYKIKFQPLEVWTIDGWCDFIQSES
jgi:arginine-tRNA-protein transferase